MKTSWTLEVQEDSATGDCILEFPPELMAQAGWKEGDTLIWKDQGDGSWSLAKKLSTKERAQALYIQARNFLLDSFKSKP